MKRNRFNFTLVPILAISIIAGMSFYLIKFDPQLNFKMLAIITLIVASLGIPLYRNFQNRKDFRANIPIEDEMSRLLEVFSGAYAFRYSMFLWLFIFLFNEKFTDVEGMLGTGILGAGVIYGLTWLYFKKNGLPSANED